MADYVLGVVSVRSITHADFSHYEWLKPVAAHDVLDFDGGDVGVAFRLLADDDREPAAEIIIEPAQAGEVAADVNAVPWFE